MPYEHINNLTGETCTDCWEPDSTCGAGKQPCEVCGHTRILHIVDTSWMCDECDTPEIINRTTVVIHWPQPSFDGQSWSGPNKLRTEFRMDECLIFYPDGRISDNGGPVNHSDISGDDVDQLPDYEQLFVRSFLDDPARSFQNLDPRLRKS